MPNIALIEERINNNAITALSQLANFMIQVKNVPESRRKQFALAESLSINEVSLRQMPIDLQAVIPLANEPVLVNLDTLLTLINKTVVDTYKAQVVADSVNKLVAAVEGMDDLP